MPLGGQIVAVATGATRMRLNIFQLPSVHVPSAAVSNCNPSPRNAFEVLGAIAGPAILLFWQDSLRDFVSFEMASTDPPELRAEVQV